MKALKSFNRWKNDSLANKLFDIANYSVLFLAVAVCLYPLYYIVLVSFSSQVTGVVLLPVKPTLDPYKMILGDSKIWIGYGNTIFYAGVGTLANLAVTLPCAYALSRKDFVGRGLVTAFIMVTMFISGGLVPSYLNISNLGLINTRLVIILVGLTSAYNIVVSRTFFASTIPTELLEAAKIDGCGNFNFFVRVVLPLSKPIMAVMALYFGVARWNSYFTEMIYLNDIEKYPLTLFLRRLLSSIDELQSLIMQGMIDDVADALASMQLATVMQYVLIVVSTVPMMIIYPFMQKYFAKGVMIGSVKG